MRCAFSPSPFYIVPIAMTLTPDAKTALAEHGLDRNDALLAAKCIGQTMIEDSTSSDTPLKGMVYDGWGLYDDGMPACRFAVPNEDGEIVFSGQFRAEGDTNTPFVERRQTISLDTLKTLIEEASSGP